MEQHFENEHEEHNQNQEIETQANSNIPAHQFTTQNNRTTSPYYGMAQTVQVPKYTVEQTMMQESIRADAYGLLKIRESMKVLCISLLIVLSMMLMFNVVALIQLTIFGFVSGGSIRFFSATEIFTIRIFYIVFICIGSIGFVNLVILLRKVNKIRAVSIPKLETTVNRSVLSAILFTSSTLFFSTFWLMTNQTSYWMYFLFQGSLVFIAYVFIYLLVMKMDTIFKKVKKHHIRQDNKPKAEIEYYKPIGYKTEMRYINR